MIKSSFISDGWKSVGFGGLPWPGLKMEPEESRDKDTERREKPWAVGDAG